MTTKPDADAVSAAAILALVADDVKEDVKEDGQSNRRTEHAGVSEGSIEETVWRPLFSEQGQTLNIPNERSFERDWGCVHSARRTNAFIHSTEQVCFGLTCLTGTTRTRASRRQSGLRRKSSRRTVSPTSTG